MSGIEMRGARMYHNGDEVNCVDLRLALSDFCEFIEEQGPRVILVAHAGFRFDFTRYFTFLMLAYRRVRILIGNAMLRDRRPKHNQ